MREKLFALIEEQLGVPKGYVKPEHQLSFMGMDSLDFLELIQTIREKIYPVTNKEMIECDTVADILAVLESKAV